MLFKKFKALLPYYGFQMKTAGSVDEFKSELLVNDAYAIVSEKSLFWYVPEVTATDLMREFQAYALPIGEFETADVFEPGRRILQMPLSFSDYENVAALMEFLLSGFVRGFLVENMSFVFNPVLAAMTSPLRSGGDQAALDCEALEREIAGHSDDAILINHLAKLQMELGQSGKAIGLFSRAATIVPHFGEPYSNMGAALWQQGEKGRAFNLFCEALLRNPFTVSIQDNFISTGLELGEFEKMSACLGSVARFFPEYGELSYLQALLLFKQGDLGESRRILSGILSLAPGDERARKLLDEVSAAT